MSVEAYSQFADSEEISAERLEALDREIAELEELLAKLAAELQDN